MQAHILFAVTLLAGCLDLAPTPTTELKMRGEELAAATTTLETDDMCDKLPDTGACALACDPEAPFEEYIPRGTCVLIRCTLTDGETFGSSACPRSRTRAQCHASPLRRRDDP
jgi:hypothetical protein